MQLNVSFVENPKDKCVPASVGMVLGYFLPDRPFTMPEFEAMCAYRPGEGAWPYAHWLSLRDLGFDIEVVEQFDLRSFAEDPVAYLQTILDDPEVLAFQLRNVANLRVEADRAKECLRRGIHHANRHGTVQDIRRFLDDGWLVRLEVDAMTLAGVPGYEGHSLIAVGYTDDVIIVHNPDGRNGNKPYQHVDWSTFIQAWQNMGGPLALNAYRLPR